MPLSDNVIIRVQQRASWPDECGKRSLSDTLSAWQMVMSTVFKDTVCGSLWGPCNAEPAKWSAQEKIQTAEMMRNLGTRVYLEGRDKRTLADRGWVRLHCLRKTGLNSSLFGLLWSLCPEPRAPFSFPALMSQRKGPQIGRTSLRFQSPDLQQDILLQDTAVQLPSPWQPCLLTFLFIISSQSWLLSMHQELTTSKTQKACTVSPWSQSVCAHKFMFCAWLQRHRCHNRLLTTLVA